MLLHGTNSGTGSTTYDISTVSGPIPLDTSTGRLNNGLATQAADIGYHLLLRPPCDL